jgi:uncharacterized membrane protein YccC
VLGITCATVSHSLLWPQSVGERLGLRLHAWLRDAEQWMSDATTGDRHTGRDRRQLAVDALECVQLATHVPYDTSHWREATRVVQALLHRMLLLLPLLSGMTDRRRALGEDPHAAQAGEQARQWIAEGMPAPIPDFVHCAGQGRDWPALLRESFLVRLAQSAQVMAQCRQLLARLDNPDALLPDDLAREGEPIRLSNDPGFAILAGLSASFAMMLVCTLWIWTGWPDGGGAAVMTGVFCCLFAAMDNPVPAIVSFGVATVVSIVVAGVYLFGIMPMIHDFAMLVAVLLPVLLLAGMYITHPRYGLPALAFTMGFCSSLAISEEFSADFSRFINGNLAQIVAVFVAAGVTATFRNLGTDAALARLVEKFHAELGRIAGATTPPDATHARASAINWP